MASSSSSSSSSSAAAAAAAAEVGGAADPPPRSLSLPVLWALIAAPFFALAYFARGLHWQPFLAGGLSCALSHGVATPFDVVKTRMQTNPEMYDGSVAAAFRRIARHEGPSFLWQGLGPTVVGYGLEGAVKIGVYELLKPVLRASGLNAFWSFIAAGFASGVVASLVLCPAEDIRIRMVADPEYVPKGKGTLSAFLRLCKEEGLLGAYSGFWAMNAKQVPYTISKQCSFDYLTAASYAALGCTAATGAKAAKAAKFSAKAAKAAKAAKVSSSAAAVFLPPKALLVAGVPLAAATVAAVLSCVASQPGDVLLTATYKDSEHTHGAVGEVWESGGVRALFAGIKARLLHVISTVTVQLVAYDLLKRALGMGATGL
jgi:solute carrier family 25 phosphate transporter 3